MNTSDLEVLLTELEIAHNDRLPEDPAHFRPKAVGAILELVPMVIIVARDLIKAAKEERRDTFEAGRDSVFGGSGYEYTFEQWEKMEPPVLPELDKPPSDS